METGKATPVSASMKQLSAVHGTFEIALAVHKLPRLSSSEQLAAVEGPHWQVATPSLTTSKASSTLSLRAQENSLAGDKWAPLVEALSNAYSNETPSGAVLMGIVR